MTFMVALDDVPTFVAAISGTAEDVDIGGGTIVSRVIPLVHPDYPTMFAIGFRSESFGTPGGTGTSVYSPMFNKARVTVDFASVPFGFAGGDAPYYTISTDFSATKEIIPGSAYRFADMTKTNGDVSLDILEIAMVVTTYQSPAPVGAAIRGVIGRLNNAVFLDCPIGTVRFDGVKSEFQKTMFSTTYTKTFNLRYRERNWNEVVRPTGGWEAPVDVVTGATRYPLGNLSVLLQ